MFRGGTADCKSVVFHKAGSIPAPPSFRGMAERLIADVCYTSVGNTTVGSNPSPSTIGSKCFSSTAVSKSAGLGATPREPAKFRAVV